MQTIRVQERDFDVGHETGKLRALGGGIGAMVSFTGLVRDHTHDHADGKPLEQLTLEHYPGMTEKALEKIADEAQQRWSLEGVTVIHRTGSLQPGDQIVLVITASAHRQAAFEAAEFLMDWLKTKAPFWKQELSGGKTEWVEARTQDDQAAKRWQK